MSSISHSPATLAGSKGIYLLPIVSLLFLFSGFYKGLVWSPIDLTVLTCAATVLAISPYWREGVDLLRQPAIWVAAALTAYLAVRTLPLPNPWGVRKLAEYVLFGVPALAAGYILTNDEDRYSAFIDVASYLAIPATALITVVAALGDPYSFGGVGSANYQVVGALLSIIMLACVASKRWLLLSLSLFAVYIVGNISAAVFTPLAALYVAARQRSVPPFVKAVGVSMAIAVAYGVIVSPPLIAMRAFWTVGAIEAKVRHMLPAPLPSESVTTGKPNLNSAPITEAIIDALPESMRTTNEIQIQAASRFDIFASAWKQFLAAPVFGNGYGTLEYAGHPYPHNAVLEMLAEGGVIAAALLLAFSLFSIWPNVPSSFALALLFVTLSRAMFSGYFGSRLIMFAFGVAIGTALSTTRAATDRSYTGT